MLVRRNIVVRTPTVPCDKQPVVRTDQKALADFVRQTAKEKGLSLRQVARRGQISHVTVTDVVNGNRKDIKSDTLLALARGLDVSEQEIFAASLGSAAGADFDNSEFEALYQDLRKLSEEDQRELMPVIDMLRADIRRRKSKADSQ